MNLPMWLKLLKRYEEVWIVTSSKALVETLNLHQKTIPTTMMVRRSTTLTVRFLINFKVPVAKKSKLTLELTWWSLLARVISAQSVGKIIVQINLQTQDLTLMTSTQAHQSNRKHRLQIFSSLITTLSQKLTLEECKILWIFLVNPHPHHKSTLLSLWTLMTFSQLETSPSLLLIQIRLRFWAASTPSSRLLQ